jgi:polycomb protein EED
MFTRLAQFHTPECSVQFFMRFRMFHAPGKHPILAFANAKSKTFFWDFARFGAYREYMAELREAHRLGKPLTGEGAAVVQKPSWLAVKRGKKPAAASAASTNAGTGRDVTPSLSGTNPSVTPAGGATDKDQQPPSASSIPSASLDPDTLAAAAQLGWSRDTLQAWASMYDLSNPVGYVKAHRTLQIEPGFVGRQVGWSPEGEWCVVVGNGNRALIYQRWGKEKGVAVSV